MNATNPKKSEFDQESLLFDLNMRECERTRPALHRLLENTSISDSYLLFESAHQTRLKNLIDQEADVLYYENDDPLGSMASHIETCVNDMQGIMVCLGFGLGYGTLMLVQQKNYVSRSIVVVEPDPAIILLAFKSLDCREILSSNDVIFLVGQETAGKESALIAHFIESNRLVNAKNVQIIDLPASVRTHSETHQAMVKTIKQAILEGVKLFGNCPNDALEGLDRTLANLPAHTLMPGVKPLEGAFKGKPGIVVSAGPSLAKNINGLRGLGDQVVMASADATLEMLVRHGIYPHFVTSVERVETTSQLFDDLTEEDCKNTYLVGSPVCHPATFKKYPGVSISCEREHDFFNLLGLEKGKLSPGPSSGNMAFRLLKYLGCDPIILVGQDLALSETGDTHPEGSRFGTKQWNYLFENVEVPGNYTPSLLSNPILKMFHSVYEYDISNFNGRVINATEGGAKIEGTELLTLQEALKEHEVQCSEIERPLWSSFSAARESIKQPNIEDAEAHFQSKTLAIMDALNLLEEISALLDKGEEAANTFLDAVETNTEEEEILTAQLSETMNAISELSAQPEFRAVAIDVLSAVFMHTMMDYNQAIANAETLDMKQRELARNVKNLANNFRVLLRFVSELYSQHLKTYPQSIRMANV